MGADMRMFAAHNREPEADLRHFHFRSAFLDWLKMSLSPEPIPLEPAPSHHLSAREDTMKNDDIAFDIANFAALAVEWGFYGVSSETLFVLSLLIYYDQTGCSVPLFIITLKELFQPLRHHRKTLICPPTINKKAIFATFALFLLTTMVRSLVLLAIDTTG
ncbi:hypothetical protein AAF712_002556 [Marasmius tenuissimus]|uniref:Uncharacterized protein n=1 Tax=Marasmius tenuissimus TaxID=585030 RepID=A0ABR3AAH2_9AGAR